MLPHEPREQRRPLVGLANDPVANVVEPDTFEELERFFSVACLVVAELDEGRGDFEYDALFARATEVPAVANVHIPLAMRFGDVEITNCHPLELPARLHAFVMTVGHFTPFSRT